MSSSSVSDIARKAFESGNQEVEKSNLDKAEKQYLKAVDSAPKWVDPLIKLGALTFQQGSYDQSKRYFQKALSLDSLGVPTIFFKLGEIAWIEKDYSQVEKNMSNFLQAEKIRPNLRTRAEKYLRDAKFLDQDPPVFATQIFALPATINTEALEYLPSLPAREDIMIFTRRVGGQEDFFISRFLDEKWQQSVPLQQLNTPQNEGAHCLSADGKMLVYTACGKYDGLGSCDLYYSVFEGNKWSAPANLGPAVNSKHWDGQPSLSASGRTLYFSSERPGGKGGRDIWRINRKGGGWDLPVNLNAINTPFNEEAPFIHAADEDLYFMSDGHPGYGGIDLFVSKKIDDEFTSPQNLGAPINSNQDEGALHMTLDGTRAYFARAIPQENKATPAQVDIYQFDVPKEIGPNPATFINLKTIDAISQASIQAVIKIVDLATGKAFMHALTDKNGEMLVCLPAGKDLALNVSKDEYAFYSQHFNLLDTSTLLRPQQLLVALHRIESISDTVAENSPVVLNNVFFESGSAKLLETSNFELENLALLLKYHNQIKIKILGHTDNIGSELDNQQLSEARAEAIYRYLLTKNVDRSRMSFLGLGESQPIAENDTEEGRQKNRRTEFILMK
jgi:outer membrane protein OmpA-like peptidoglycan-associated protein